jgi:hypothetical protein
MQPPAIPPKSAQQVNRRELLKALTASGGGLLAAAFLPGKWARPVVEAGLLPAHAQGSCTVPLELVSPISPCSNCPYGNVAHISYSPSTPIPTSVVVFYGTVGVPSVLGVDKPGFFDVYFALPATPPPSNMIYIDVAFDNGCTGSAQGPYL